MKLIQILLISIIVITKEKYGLSTHTARFDTERKCHDFLVHIRWNDKPQCPACENDNMNYYLSSRNLYKCSCCYKQFSVIKGTIFERSRVPLTKWFLAIYLFTTKKRGISSCQMAKWLDVKQPTAWFMLHRLREALKDENEIVLSGIVEADETSIGPNIDRDTRFQRYRKKHYEQQDAIYGMENSKKRRHRGTLSKRGRKKGETNEMLKQRRIEREAKGKRIQYERETVIFGMIERGSRVVMKKIGHSKNSITKKNIYPHLIKHISSNSILITDQSKVYLATKNIFPEHLIINHNKKIYVVGEVHTNNIENAWKHLKKTVIGTYFHLSRWHFDKYFDENTYRYNRRNESIKVLFEDFMPLILGKR